MVDPKEVELIKTDLDLVTKTAKVLATKLEKITTRIDKVMSTLGQVEGQSTPTTNKVASKPTPVRQKPQKRAKPVERAPERGSNTVTFNGTNPKVEHFLESFLSQIESLSSGKDIAQALSALRDQVMQSAEVGFHPAFHEMGRHANRLKKLRTISEDDRQELIDKIMDWKARLS